MTWQERGRIQGGAIVLARPLPLPEGTEVSVRVEAADRPVAAATEDFASLPFFGMWSERSDLADSTAWVRQERQRWQQRAPGQD